MSFPFLPALRRARCGDPGQSVDFSCVFDGAQTLTRTPAEGDRTRHTFGFWCRLAATGIVNDLLSVLADDYNYDRILLHTDDTLQYQISRGNSIIYILATSRKFRDTAGWYHFHFVFDTSAADPADRLNLTVNGIRETALASFTPPPQGYTGGYIGGAMPHRIASLASPHFGVYYGRSTLHSVYYLDGIAADARDFGYTNRHGVWVPRRYAGAYGPTGWHLDFADPLDLGHDASGNGNHWTTSGLTAANQVTDTPTSTYCTLASNVFGGFVLSDGGLRVYHTGAGSARAAGTMVFDAATDAVSWQVTTTTTSAQQWYVGIAGERTIASGVTYTNEAVISYDGSVVVDGVWVSPRPVAAIPNGARLEIAIIRGAMYLWVDGAPSPADGSPVVSGLTGRRRPLVGFGSSGNNNVTHTLDFGQRGYQPRPGTRLLCTRDMACPAIKRPERYATTRLRSAGAAVADLPWSPLAIKTAVLSHRQDAAADWRLNLSILPGRALTINAATADALEADGLTYTAAGYTVGANAAYAGTRKDYLWRASAAAGCDIVLVNHTTGAPTTVPHAAGGIIDYAWVLPVGVGGNRRAYHRSLAAGQYYQLNSTNVYGTDAGWFASTAVDVTLGASMPTGLYALLLWRAVPGFSAFGSYLGNGLADGAMVPMDFAPRMVIGRRLDRATWIMEAAANPVQTMQYPHEAATPYTSTAYATDFLSNGLKHRAGDPSFNPSGVTLCYAAWADTPGKFARAR